MRGNEYELFRVPCVLRTESRGVEMVGLGATMTKTVFFVSLAFLHSNHFFSAYRMSVAEIVRSEKAVYVRPIGSAICRVSNTMSLER